MQIRRIHRYDLAGQPSSFGPGVYLNYDISLRADGTTVTITDPNAGFGVVLTADAAGSYTNATHNLCKRFTLTDALGTIVTTPQAARTAELETQDGNVYRFEFIDAGDSVLRGRLIAHVDRNGNAIQIAHVFAPDASQADLGNDRSKLWQISTITDAHGLSATCTYAAGSIAGRPVISRIDLPTGDHIDYQYNQPALGFSTNDIVGFSGATLPGGDTVSITASRESGLVKLVVDDPAAQGIHRRKTVWLTEPNITDPRNSLQVSYQIREVRNGDGEVVYRCRIEALGSDWATVVQEDANVLYRLVHEKSGTPKRTDYAVTWDWSQPSSTYAWETVGTYAYDSLRRPTSWTDALGHVTTSQPDPSNNAPTLIAHPDGTSEHRTYGAFTQVTESIDRQNRKTTRIFDGRGNLLSETTAVGTPDEATRTFTYNTRGQVLTQTDARGFTTSFTYTAAGYLETITDPPDVLGGPTAVTRFEYDAAGRRTAAVDPVGRRSTFGWDVRNRQVSTTYADTSTEISTYGSGITANLVIAQQDRNGRVTAIDFDASGRRVATRLAVNAAAAAANQFQVLETSSYVPGAERILNAVRLGERIDNTFDYRGRQTATTVWPTASTSLITTNTFDANSRLISQTDAFNRRTLMVYDINDRLTRTVRELVPGGVAANADLATLVRVTTENPPYVIEETQYDADGEVLARIDGNGVRTAFAYDDQGRMLTTTEAADSAPATTHFEYDIAGNRTAVTTPRGVRTETTYNGRNLVATVTEAAGTAESTVVRSVTYTPTRKPATETDALGRVTTYNYGTCCDRLKKITDPAGFETSFTYDFVGNRETVTDPNGLITITAYDARNRPVTVTNANVPGEITRTAYDDDLTDGIGIDDPAQTAVAAILANLGLGAGADGSAIAVTNPANQTSIEIHDGLGRPVRRIDPLGHVVSYAYDQTVTDGTDQLVATSVTDALQRTNARWTDGSGRARVVVDALGQKTRQGMDANGNQVSLSDPNQVGWTATYHPRGFLLTRRDTRTTQPGTTSWGYDADGNRTSETDAADKVEIYDYDLRNRRTAIHDRLNGLTHFDFDLVGNLTTITDAENGITSYAYDSRNLLVQETFPGPTGGTRSYTYDPGRRLLTRTQQTATAGGN